MHLGQTDPEAEMLKRLIRWSADVTHATDLTTKRLSDFRQKKF